MTDKISAQRAAELLGVSRMQISRLVSAGELDADRFGQALQISLDSLHRYDDLRPQSGRPVSARAAWQRLRRAALERDVNSVDSLKELAVAVRRRADRHELRMLPGAASRLLADQRIVVSGVDAAIHHGASVRPSEKHQVYVRTADFEQVVDQYRLRPDHDASNIIVRAAPDDAWLFDSSSGKFVPAIIAALDLVDDRDDRAAAEVLKSS